MDPIGSQPDSSYAGQVTCIQRQINGAGAMWYYATDKEPVGPLSEGQVKDAIADKQITPNTLVWREGLSEWILASAATEIAGLFRAAAPPVPDSSGRAEPPTPLGQTADLRKPTSAHRRDRNRVGVALPVASIGSDAAFQNAPGTDDQGDQPQTLARPWPRFFARMLDLMIFSYALTFSFAIAGSLYFPKLYLAVFSIDDRIFGILLVPISMIGCALILGIFGNTLGRWLFGIRITRLTAGPDMLFYLRREMAVWVAGLGLGIPIATLITNYLQYRRVSRKEPASYDAGETAVLAKPISILRPIVGVICLLALYGGAVFLGVAAKDDEIIFGQTKPWTNPVTNEVVQIAGYWEPSEWKSDGGKLYHFNSGSLLIECLFGFEEVSGYLNTTDAYASAVQITLKDTLEFYGGWVPAEVNGHTALRSHAKVTDDGTTDVLVTVFVDGAGAWRTLLFVRGREADSVDEGRDLLSALWQTVDTRQ